MSQPTKQTVLVIAQAQDGTASQVIDALRTRGVAVESIDLADFPDALSLVATPERIDSPGYLCLRGRRIDLASVRSVYRRSWRCSASRRSSARSCPECLR